MEERYRTSNTISFREDDREDVSSMSSLRFEEHHTGSPTERSASQIVSPHSVVRFDKARRAASGLGAASDIEAWAENGGDVNEMLPSGDTCLHRAAATGTIDVISVLLKYKADINRQSIGGRTPLHEAAYAGRSEAVRQLLDAGADFTIPDNTGLLPCGLAMEGEQFETAKLFPNYSAAEEVSDVGELSGSGLDSGPGALMSGSEPPAEDTPVEEIVQQKKPPAPVQYDGRPEWPPKPMERRYTFGATAFNKKKSKEREDEKDSPLRRGHSWKTGLRPNPKSDSSSRPAWALSPNRAVRWMGVSNGGGHRVEHAHRPLGDLRAFGDPYDLPAVRPMFEDQRTREQTHQDVQRLRGIEELRAKEASVVSSRLSHPHKVREREWGTIRASTTSASSMQLKSSSDIKQSTMSRFNELRTIDQQRYEENRQRKAELQSPLKQREMAFKAAALNQPTSRPFPPLLAVHQLKGRREVKANAKYTQWEQDQKKRLAVQAQREAEEAKEVARDPFSSTSYATSSLKSPTSSPNRVSPRPRARPLSPQPKTAAAPPRSRSAGTVPTSRRPNTATSARQTPSRQSAEVRKLRRENEELKYFVGRFEGMPPEFADDASLPAGEREVRRRLRDAFVMGKVSGSLAGSPRKGRGSSPGKKAWAKTGAVASYAGNTPTPPGAMFSHTRHSLVEEQYTARRGEEVSTTRVEEQCIAQVEVQSVSRVEEDYIALPVKSPGVDRQSPEGTPSPWPPPPGLVPK